MSLQLLPRTSLLDYKHLDEPLDEGRFAFESTLAWSLLAFTRSEIYTSFSFLLPHNALGIIMAYIICSRSFTATKNLSSRLQSSGEMVSICETLGSKEEKVIKGQDDDSV